MGNKVRGHEYTMWQPELVARRGRSDVSQQMAVHAKRLAVDVT
jgi:hypothetical protein